MCISSPTTFNVEQRHSDVFKNKIRLHEVVSGKSVQIAHVTGGAPSQSGFNVT